MKTNAPPRIRNVTHVVFAVSAALLFLGQAQADSADWHYTVQANDTLTSIARRYLKEPKQWSSISKSNAMTAPDLLRTGSLLRIPTALLRYRAGQATLTELHGTVRWRAIGSNLWLDASNGQIISAGLELETDKNSSALLRLADKSEILLTSNSYLKIDNLSQFVGAVMLDSTVSLLRGESHITANPTQRTHQNLKVLTPSAQAVVRGTKFRVAFDDHTMREETLGGRVEVSAAENRVEVAAQMGTLARQGEAPSTPVKLRDAPDVNAFPLKFEQLPLTLVLPALAGAKAWAAELAPDAHFKQILWSTTTSSSELTLPDLPNGAYALHLRAVDHNGLQGADALHMFTVDANPVAPTLDAPTSGALVRFAQPTFSWSKVQGARAYHLQISRRADFTTQVYDIHSPNLNWQPDSDLPGESLYWRVASIDGQRQGPWSIATLFIHQPGPGTVALGQSTPRVDATNVCLDLPPPPPGLLYEATLSANAILMPTLMQIRTSDGAIKLPRPPAGTWFFAIRLIDPIDNTPGYNTVQKITVAPRSN